MNDHYKLTHEQFSQLLSAIRSLMKKFKLDRPVDYKEEMGVLLALISELQDQDYLDDADK